MGLRADESRAAFLRAAEELVLRTGEVSLVESLSIKQLLEAVPREITRGAFTYHWPTRSAFEQDLLIWLAEGVRSRSEQRLSAGTVDAESLVAAGMTFDSFLGVAIEFAVESLSTSQDLPVLLGLWSRALNNEALRSIMEQSCKTADHAFADQMRRALSCFGRQTAPGTDVNELSVAMSALAFGLALREAIQPGDPECSATLRVGALIGVVDRLTVVADGS